MSETPYAPAEPPADGDRAQQPPQRFTASASVPMPPPMPAPPFAGGPAPGEQAPGMPPAPPMGQPPFGQPPLGQPPAGSAPAGQPPAGASPFGQPPFGQPPAGDSPAPGSPPPGGPSASGQARVSGSASVPGSGSYGGPPAPPAFAAAPPSFGAPPAAAPAPPAPPAPFGQPPAPSFEPPGRPSSVFGSAPAPQPYGQGPFGPPPGGGPAGGPGGGPGGPGGPSGPGGGGHDWQERSAPAPVQRKPRRGLIITLVTVAVLVVVGIGSYIGLALDRSGADYRVGACVKKEGTGAVVVDCSEPEAYRIVSSVGSESECDDVSQPWLEVREPTGGRSARCLVPAG